MSFMKSNNIVLISNRSIMHKLHFFMADIMKDVSIDPVIYCNGIYLLEELYNKTYGGLFLFELKNPKELETVYYLNEKMRIIILKDSLVNRLIMESADKSHFIETWDVFINLLIKVFNEMMRDADLYKNVATMGSKDIDEHRDVMLNLGIVVNESSRLKFRKKIALSDKMYLRVEEGNLHQSLPKSYNGPFKDEKFKHIYRIIQVMLEM